MKIQLLIVGALVLAMTQAYAGDGDEGVGETQAMPSPSSAQSTTQVQASVPDTAAEMESEVESEAEQESEDRHAPGHVGRAVFTSAIEAREPANQLDKIENTTGKVYFFSELLDMDGQTVTHRWLYNGKTMADVNFKVGGSRWRVHSSKNMMPGWTGDWKVEVLNGEGRVISTQQFEYVPGHHAENEEIDGETVPQGMGAGEPASMSDSMMDSPTAPE